MPPSADDPLRSLLRHLELEACPGQTAAAADRFVGHSPPTRNDRLFGGLVFAQAMRAAQATVEARAIHSAHAYFLRAGDPARPIEYAVDRIRDGRTFTTRRVVAFQADRAIFNLSCSFQEHDDAPGRQIDVDVPPQPAGESFEDGVVRAFERRGIEVSRTFFGELPIEILAEGGVSMNDPEPRPPELRAWLRARGPMPDDPALHQAVLAYASDYTIVVAAPFPFEWGVMAPDVQSASLDHAIWFHDDFRIDDGIYAVQESPVLKGSRGLGRALYYARDGRLVASAVQEGLMRRRG